MKRIGHWIKGHRTAILAGLLILSLAGNGIQLRYFSDFCKKAAEPADPVGTYCTDQSAPNAVYFVLDQQGNYCRYRQFELLEAGIYEAVASEAGLYCLWDSERTAARGYALVTKGNVYLVRDGAASMLPKIGSVPGYINVDAPYPIY